VEISCPHLQLTRPWEEEQFVLLRATDALRLCGSGGYEKVPCHVGVDRVQRLALHGTFDLLRFVARSGIRPSSLANLDDKKLILWLRDHVQARELVVVRVGKIRPAGQASRDADQRRVLRELEAHSRQPMRHAGRVYRLVADVQLARLRDRDSYEVVRRDNALAVLHGLAEQSPGGGLSAVLAEAAKLLANDWRPPLAPDGLVLLRRLTAVVATGPSDEPAITPSQLKKLSETDWIEIEVVDTDGNPLSTHYRLQLADKDVQEGQLPEEGFLGLYDIASDTYKLILGEAKPPTVAPQSAESPSPSPSPEPPPAPPPPPPPPPPSESPLSLFPDDVVNTFTIKLVDQDGKPVTEVPVEFRWSGGGDSRPTGSDGIASYSGPASMVTASVGLPDKVP
jgi:hypothetical protein